MSQAPSLEEIFATHLDFVWRVLRYMGVPAAQREDLAQDVFLVVQQKLSSYEERGALRAWLYAISRRVVADHRHHAAFRQQVVPKETFAGDLDEERRLEARDALSRIEDALSDLPSEQRKVFLLYEIEGMTMPEIAEALGTPLQTCYSRLHAARERVTALFRASEVR